MRVLSSVEAAWLGALVEGEGCVQITYRSKEGRSDCWRVYVGSTEIETISTILRLVGDGKIYCVFPTKLARKILWKWQLSSKQAVHDFMCQLRPYLITKGDKYFEEKS